MPKRRFSLDVAKRIGKTLGLSWKKLDLNLSEFPDYYTRLNKLEKEAEDYWK